MHYKNRLNLEITVDHKNKRKKGTTFWCHSLLDIGAKMTPKCCSIFSLILHIPYCIHKH